MPNYNKLFLILSFAIFTGAHGYSEPPEFDRDFRLKSTYQVKDFTYSKAHISLSMETGQIAEVFVGNRKIGLFFQGKGTYTYLSQDAYEQSVMQNNLKRGTSLKGKLTKQGLQITDQFKTAFILFQGGEIPSLTGIPLDSGLLKPFTDHLNFFERVRMTPRRMLFIKQALDSPSQKVVQIEIRGGAESVLYQYDPIMDQCEYLYAVIKNKHQISGIRKTYIWPVFLSNQPIGRSRKDFLSPPFLLTDLTYNLQAYNKDDRATLYITETITPMTRDQRVFMFEFYNRKWDSKGEPRDFKLNYITDESGLDLPFIHEKNTLLVMLPKAAEANKPFKLNFDVEGNFLIRPNGNNFWQLGVEPWFPQPGLSGQYYTVHSTIRTQDPFIPIAPGKTLRRIRKNGFTVLKTEITHPVQFAVANAGKYFFEEDTQNGLTIRVASYGTQKKESIAKLQRLARRVIEYYEPWLGPFPFSEFNILEVASYGFGQAPPGTMYITKEAFNPLEDRLSQIYSGGVNHRFAHEIAHQYWGHIIKMGTYEEQWLTESFAEYSSSMFVEQLKGKGGYKRMVSNWKNNAKSAAKYSSIPMANYMSGPGAGRKRIYLVYDKGAYLLYTLHQELGDTRFFSFLRSYQGVLAWKFGTTGDCVKLLNAITKKDYSEFFEKYYWGTEMPK